MFGPRKIWQPCWPLPDLAYSFWDVSHSLPELTFRKKTFLTKFSFFSFRVGSNISFDGSEKEF
jgi:hypothetical protein